MVASWMTTAAFFFIFLLQNFTFGNFKLLIVETCLIWGRK